MDLAQRAEETLREREIRREVAGRRLSEMESRHAAEAQSLAVQEERAGHMVQANAIMRRLVEELNSENLRKIEVLVNDALEVVFDDQEVEFRIVPAAKRGNTVYGVEMTVGEHTGGLDAFGGGVWAMVAVVLKIVFNRLTERYPLLVLDESLSFLANQYIPTASALLRQISERFRLPVLLVTHQAAFAASADVAYTASRSGRGTVFTAEPNEGET